MKRILLFSDGTGNSSAKAQKTNVWRLFQAAKLTGTDQIAHYDDGVGSSSNKYLAILGGVFGWGLKRNVIDLYKFVCLNYHDGDHIFGFGFSRGAFTIRVLVGLIANQGLLHPMGSEELDRYARAAYRAFRRERISPKNPFFALMRSVRDWCLRRFDEIRDLPPYRKAKNRQEIPIQFLGLWDTVGAYEIPITALKRAVGKVLFPMEFVNCALSEKVKHACHALSLDDERQTFHPVPFDEEAEARLVDERKVEPGRLKQVWFPGVHSNVGGGYPEDRLSYVALHWIMSEAAATGMQLIPGEVDKIVAERSPYARIYDSRAGFASFYRYSPRRIRIWQDPKSGKQIDPVIDSSVLLRMADGTDRYAPVPLPGRFWVLEETGTLIPMFGAPGIVPANAVQRQFPVVARLGVAGTAGAIASTLTAACKRFQPAAIVLPHPQALEVVANTVWWRRAIYWLQFAFAAALVFFPAYSSNSLCADQQCSRAEAAFVGVTGDALERSINAIKGVLPSVSTRWTDAFGANPDIFALLAFGLLLSMNLSRVLKIRISDRVRMAWHQNFQPIYLQWCRRSARASCRVTVVMLVVAIVLTSAAPFLPKSTPTRELRLAFTSTEITYTTAEFAILSVFLFLLLLWRIYRLRVLMKAISLPGAPLPTTGALALAGRLRGNAQLARFYRHFSEYALPGLCIVAFFYVAVVTVNRGIFDAALASGELCNVDNAQRQSAAATFKTSNFCWDSEIVLDKGATYLVTLKTDGNWFDATERADVGGFPTDSLKHFEAWFLRRDWSEPWFKPIARIGATGNDEYVLDPVAPFVPHRYRNTLPPEKDHYQPISDITALTGMKGDPTPADRMTLSAKITAHTSGELFLYVNDAVLAPPFTRTFYPNNYGTAEVTIDRLCPDGTLWRVTPPSQPPAGKSGGASQIPVSSPSGTPEANVEYACAQQRSSAQTASR